MSKHSKVYILILNWNGWKDTIECLESIFKSDYDNYQVIVCDNNSSNNSLDYIKKWADGLYEPEIDDDNDLKDLIYPYIKKPITYVEYNREQAENGPFYEDDNNPLVLIQTGANLGFAGGNNVGLRYALAKDDFDYVWLLNNDTVIKKDSLKNLVIEASKDRNIGMCGSTLLYYDKPHKVQALGGATFNKWFAVPKHIGIGKDFCISFDKKEIEKKMDYVAGASMLVSKAFLKDVGLICEDYFLYFEEIDWATRAKGKFRLAYAPDSIVYHKEGKTIGANSNKKNQKSYISDYYIIKNRLLFTYKYYKYFLPTVYGGLFISIFNRIRRKQINRIWMILRLFFNFKNNT